MAFGATITVTVNAVAKVLNRIKSDDYGSEYLLRNGSVDEFRLFITHRKETVQADGRWYDNHKIELHHTVFGSGVNPDVKRIAQSTFRVLNRDDLTAAGYLTAALIDYVDSGTVQADLLTWQS